MERAEGRQPDRLGVAIAQLAPHPGDVAANLTMALETVEASRGADLIVFPEMFLCGYDPQTAGTTALAPEHPALADVARAGANADVAVIMGAGQHTPAGVVNVLQCSDRDGRIVARYAKTYLFAEERQSMVAGDELVVTRLAGVRVGLLICFDLEFPEPSRALVGAGAQMLVACAANFDPLGPDHDLASRARALDNRRPVVYCNRVGSEAGRVFVGESGVVDASGSWVARAPRGIASVLRADVDLSGPPEADLDYLRYVRDDLRVADYTAQLT